MSILPVKKKIGGHGGSVNSENDRLNNKYAIIFPLILSLLFAVIKIYAQWQFAGSDGGSLDLLVSNVHLGIEIVCDCFSSAFVPFVLLTAIQHHFLKIDNGLDKERAVALYVVALIHFAFYICYLAASDSGFYFFLMVMCCVASVFALFDAVQKDLLKKPSAISGHSPSGVPDDVK